MNGELQRLLLACELQGSFISNQFVDHHIGGGLEFLLVLAGDINLHSTRSHGRDVFSKHSEKAAPHRQFTDCDQRWSVVYGLMPEDDVPRDAAGMRKIRSLKAPDFYFAGTGSFQR